MIRLGSRGSALALAQADLVAALIGEDVEIVRVETSGDRGRIGDKGRFVKEIEDALLADRVDLAVHSAKDVPGELPEGLAIAGVPERADPRDALCGAESVEALPEGAVVGTASLRRLSQLLALRPDLDVRDVRGNVDTRLGKLADGEYGALVLAAAGLARLGRPEGTPIPEETMTPAPGQGCLALETRADDGEARAVAERITDRAALVELTAERAVVTALEATCDTPVGARARLDGDRLALDAYAGRPDGSSWIRDAVDGSAADPAAAGRELADRMLQAGARSMLR